MCRIPQISVLVFALLLPSVLTHAQSCQELRIAEYRRPQYLCPNKGFEPEERRLQALIFESPVKVNPAYKYQDLLIKKIEMASADNLSCTCTLRDDILWTDMKRLTADDGVFSINSHCTLGRDRRVNTLGIKKAEKLSETEFKLLFNAPHTEIQVRSMLCHILFVKAAEYDDDLQTEIARTQDACLKPTGTGWYWMQGLGLRDLIGAQATLKLLPSSTGGHRKNRLEPMADPLFESVKITYFANAMNAINGLKQKAMDFMPEVPMSKWPSVDGIKGISAERIPSNLRWSIVIDMNHELLGLKPVREAIALSINRESLAKEHLKIDKEMIRDQLLSGPFSSEEFLADPELLPRSFDLKRARAIMDSVRSVFDKQGVEYSNELMMRYISGMPDEYNNVAKMIPVYLSDIGFKVDLKQLAPKNLDKLRENGNFDLLLLEWESDRARGTHLARLFGTDISGIQNFGNFKNPIMNGLIRQILQEKDGEFIKKLCWQAHRICHRDLPHVFLFKIDNAIAYSRIVPVDRHPSNIMGWIDTWRCEKSR